MFTFRISFSLSLCQTNNTYIWIHTYKAYICARFRMEHVSKVFFYVLGEGFVNVMFWSICFFSKTVILMAIYSYANVILNSFGLKCNQFFEEGAYYVCIAWYLLCLSNNFVLIIVILISNQTECVLTCFKYSHTRNIVPVDNTF